MINEARYLVKFDCENDVTDLTKLYAAALSTNEPLPDRILRVSVSKTSWTHRLLSPLHCACINPNLQVLKTLLRICPTFSLPDKNRRNLIHYAAVNPNDEVIKFLLANGCDANELDSGRKTPLMIAAQRGLIGNVVALIQHFENRKNKAGDKAKGGKKIDEFENEDEDARFDVDFINFKDKSSWTALHFAAQQGSAKICEILIEAGANQELRNSKQMTPVLVAAQYGNLEAVKFLQVKGGDLLGKAQKQRKNALIYASMNGHHTIVEYLLANKLVPVDQVDTSGNTALHYASAYGWPSIVKVLLANGADPNKQNLWNTTPASLAIQKYHYLILDIILNHKGVQQNPADQPFLSDSQGRDLVSQHLLSFDENTVQHFDTLTSLFKRLGLKPRDSTDHFGLNAFHYLCDKDPEEIAQRLAQRQQTQQWDEGNSDDGGDKEEEKDEEMSEDYHDGETTKEERIRIKKYNEISAQIVAIAENLERWGYSFESETLSGHTQLLIAAERKNIPMIRWLLEKGVRIRNIKDQSKQRNFLHFILDAIMKFDLKGQLDTPEFLNSLIKKFKHSDDLFVLAQEKDARGFTPYFVALSEALLQSMTAKFSVRAQWERMAQRIVDIHQFMVKIGHKFEESVPQEREYKFKNDGYDYSVRQQFDIELHTNHRFRRLNDTVYSGQNLSTLDAEAYGIIDLRILKIRETNFFVHYNWLHFLSQIIIFNQKLIDTQPLIDLLASVPKDVLRQQIFAQSQYMDSPLTLGFLNERFMVTMLRVMEVKDLKESVNGLFRSGNVPRVHLCSYLRSSEAVQYFKTQFLEKDKSLINQTDSFGNTIVHHAAYLRNYNLLEVLIPKADLRILNSKGNNVLHLAVAIKRSNQLELPKIEDLLITRCPQLLVQLNQDRQSPMVVALTRASESKIDPVNLIKVLLDSPTGAQAIDLQDSLGNTVLHIAAQLPNIPLSLSLIFQKTTKKNQKNSLGNTPLSEAIKCKRMDNALFLLQSCDDASKIQETVTLYDSYINKYLSNNGVLTEAMHHRKATDLTSFDLSKVENVHKLALQKKFFGLYHFSDSKNNPLPILIGALQAKNLVLFNQLLENYSQKLPCSTNKSDGWTLLHGLASATLNLESDSNYDEDKDNNDNINESDEEEEENEDSDNDGGGDRDMTSDQEKDEIYKNIYLKLTKEIGLKLNQVDFQGRSPLHIAAESGNSRFIDIALQGKSKKEIADLLSQETLKESLQVIPSLLKSKIDERVQLRILKKFVEVLGNEVLKLGHLYFKYSYEVPQKLFEKPVFQAGQKQQVISIVDVILGKRHKVLRYLIKLGYLNTFRQYSSVILQTACQLRDFASVKILVEDGKISVTNRNDQEQILKILRGPSDLENCWSYSTEIMQYLYQQKVITLDGKPISPFDLIKRISNDQLKMNGKQGKAHLAQIEQEIQSSFQKVLGLSKMDSKNTQSNSSLIDNFSEMTETHTIHEEGSLQMSTLMMKVDIAKNGRYGMLRFYLAQLLKERKSGQLTLWTRWGRIGDRGQNQRTPFNLDEKGALKEFKKVFKQKSGHNWETLVADPSIKTDLISGKYRIIQLGDREAEKRVATSYQSLTKHFNINFITQALEKSIEESKDESKSENIVIMRAVLDVVKKYFAEVLTSTFNMNKNRVFNMALTTDQITEAYETLSKIRATIKNIKVLQKKGKETQNLYDEMIDLNNQYYSLIPTKDFSFSYAQDLVNDYAVKSEFEKLAEIYDFSRAFKISIASLLQHDPLSYIRDILPIKLKRISEPANILENQELSMIMRYMNQSLYKNKDINQASYLVSNVYRLSDTEVHLQEEDKAVFNGLHNHWMLWHGTDKKNIMSILMKGLKIKPPNADHCGSLFGDAIYFADMFSKSLTYSTYRRSRSENDENNFYMLLCEVALGNIANYPSNWTSEVYRPPLGYHSVRAMSEKGPDFSKSVINDQKQVYPLGPIIKYPKAQLEKGIKKYKSHEGFFAEYLKKKEDSQNEIKKGKKKPSEDVDMDDGSESELEIDQDQFAPEEAIKNLEDSFLNVKEKKYEVQPNVITTDFCMKRLLKEAENFDLDNVYGSDSQYMIYSEKQVRIRYLLELKFI